MCAMPYEVSSCWLISVGPCWLAGHVPACQLKRSIVARWGFFMVLWCSLDNLIHWSQQMHSKKSLLGDKEVFEIFYNTVGNSVEITVLSSNVIYEKLQWLFMSGNQIWSWSGYQSKSNQIMTILSSNQITIWQADLLITRWSDHPTEPHGSFIGLFH